MPRITDSAKPSLKRPPCIARSIPLAYRLTQFDRALCEVLVEHPWLKLRQALGLAIELLLEHGLSFDEIDAAGKPSSPDERKLLSGRLSFHRLVDVAFVGGEMTLLARPKLRARKKRGELLIGRQETRGRKPWLTPEQRRERERERSRLKSKLARKKKVELLEDYGLRESLRRFPARRRTLISMFGAVAVDRETAALDVLEQLASHPKSKASLLADRDRGVPMLRYEEAIKSLEKDGLIKENEGMLRRDEQAIDLRENRDLASFNENRRKRGSR